VPFVVSALRVARLAYTLLCFDSLFEGVDFYIFLTCAYFKFEKLCQYLFHTSQGPVEKVLPDSKIDKAGV
jgi:L1 cell adhesion molecule like protein